MRLHHELHTLKAQAEKVRDALEALEGYENPVVAGSDQLQLEDGIKTVDAEKVKRLPRHPLDGLMDVMPPGGMKGVPRRRRQFQARKTTGPSAAVRAALAAMGTATSGEILEWITQSTQWRCTPTPSAISAILCGGRKAGAFLRGEGGKWSWKGGVGDGRRKTA